MSLRARRIALGTLLVLLPFVVAEVHRRLEIDGSTFAYLATNGLAVVGLWMFLLALLAGERKGASLVEILSGLAKDAAKKTRLWGTEGVDQPWSAGEAIGIAMKSFAARPGATAAFAALWFASVGAAVVTTVAVVKTAPVLFAPFWKVLPFLAPKGAVEAAILASRPVPPVAVVLAAGGTLLTVLLLLVSHALLAESAVAAVRSEPIAPGALGRALRRTPKFFGLTLVSVVLLGLPATAISIAQVFASYVAFFGVLLVLASVGSVLVLGTRLRYAGFFVADEDVGVFAALGKSWRVTEGYWVSNALLGIALAPMNLLGLGSVVLAGFTIPFLSLVSAFTYVRSTGRNDVPFFPADFATKSIRRYLGVTFAVLVLLFLGFSAWVGTLPTMRGSAWSIKDTAIRASAILTGVGAVIVALAFVLPFLLDALEGRRFSSFVAARHVRSPKSGFLTVISILSICGVAMSSCSLSSVVSVMGGFSADLKRKILGNNAHIVVDVTAGTPFADYPAVLERVRAVPGVTGAAAVVHGEVMASSASNIAGVMVSGVVPSDVVKVNELSSSLEVGKLEYLEHPEKLTKLPANEPIGIGPGGEQYFKQAELPPLGDDIDDAVRRVILDKPDRPGIVLGRELAKTLHVYVGDEITLVSPLGDLGPMGVLPRTKKFRVAGIFYSGMYEYDATYVYTMLDVAQDYFQTADKVSSIEIKVDDAERAELVAPLVTEAIARPDLRVRDWREINKNLFSALKLERFATFVILLIAIMVASFCIVCTLLLMVTEKGKEIAILKAVGASDGAILRIFMIEGVIIGGIGTVFGVATGLSVCAGLKWFGLRLDPEVYYIDKLPITVNASDFLAVALAAMTICTLSTLYPAYAASRLRPVDGLRYE